MFDWKNPSWWMTVAAVVGAAAGLFDTRLNEPVRGVVVAVGGLVIAVYTASHHAHSASVHKSRSLAQVAEAHAAAIVAASKQTVTPATPATVVDPAAMLAHLQQMSGGPA